MKFRCRIAGHRWFIPGVPLNSFLYVGFSPFRFYCLHCGINKQAYRDEKFRVMRERDRERRDKDAARVTRAQQNWTYNKPD
jgi:hypothetical protein